MKVIRERTKTANRMYLTIVSIEEIQIPKGVSFWPTLYSQSKIRYRRFVMTSSNIE